MDTEIRETFLNSSPSSRTGLDVFAATLLASFLLARMVYGQTGGQVAQIHGFSIEEKVNGAVIRILTTEVIESSQVTAWMTDSGWLYVTLLGTTIDTTRTWPVMKTGFVTGFEAHPFPDAVQLDFRLSRPIESLGIGASPVEREVMVTLRFPVREIAETLDRVRSRRGDEVRSDRSKAELIMSRMFGRLPYAMIVTGSGLVLSGMMQSRGTEFVGGAVVLIAGYVSIKRREAPENPEG